MKINNFKNFINENNSYSLDDIKILKNDLLKYFDDIIIKENNNDICSIIFKKDNIENNRIWYICKQEEDSKNMVGDVLYKKGETIQKTIHFGNNTIRTNYLQLKKLLNLFKSGYEISITMYKGIKF
jgi:hypothetical protein